MKKHALNAILIIVVSMCSGCIYSLDFSPTFEMPVIRQDMPSLTISLGNVSRYFLKKYRERSEKELFSIDRAFVDGLKDVSFLRALPRGSDSMLVIDFVQYTDLDPDISEKEAFRRDLLTVTGLGFITPLKFPFYLETKGTIKVYTHINEKRLLLKQYEVLFKTRIISASIIGARYRLNTIQEAGTSYLLPYFIEAMQKDVEMYRDFKTAFEDGDIKSIENICLKNSVIK